jgi:hypothetical protein
MDRFLFGTVNDPVFGKYSSGIYLQPYQNSAPPNASDVADSIVLILQYDMPVSDTLKRVSRNTLKINTFKEMNVIGDTLPQQSLTVYQLSEVMNNSLASGYYSDKVFATEGSALATFNYTAKPTSFVPSVGRNFRNTADSATGKTLPHLRIKLDKTLADKLFLNKTLLTGEGLRNILKGLYIAPAATNTCLHRFNLLTLSNNLQPVMLKPVLTSESGLVIYYHSTAAPNIPLTYRITFDGANNSIATTKFVHDRAGTPVASALLATNKKRIGDSVLYVQGMAGTNGKITFPNLGKLKGKVIINKAELTLKAISDGTNFPKPLYLGLTKKFTTGFYETIADVSYPLSYGGKINASTYTMNVTLALQSMIDGKESTTDKNLIEKYLYITSLGKLYNAQRVALGGARNTTYAPVLKVYMTRL